ncbi:MAG: hypothetical protein WCP28_09370 [Actinomycetes bacterium]
MRFVFFGLTFLDADSVLNEHLLCQKGTVGGADGMGSNPSWDRTGKSTEWVRRISVSEMVFSPSDAIYRGEPMHPVYWGQRALAACALAATATPARTPTVRCATPKSAPVPVYASCRLLHQSFPHGIAPSSLQSKT